MKDIRISVPSTAVANEIIEIKTLIRHPMETGFRRDHVGELIPRDIVERFVCVYNGEEVFRADFFPAIASNPYLTFFTVATESGTLKFRWTHQDGHTVVETAEITVR